MITIIFFLILLLALITYYSKLNYLNIRESFLNLHGTQDELDPSFIGSPYYDFKENVYEDGKIKLLKKDGIPINAYKPQIVRPIDNVHESENGKFQEWCSKSNAVAYHAMRPIIQPNDYDRIVEKLFKNISTKGPTQLGKDPLGNNIDTTGVFCTEDKKEIIDFIIKKINTETYKMPEMQNNGPWGNEVFYSTYETIYQLTPNFIRVTFGLFNTLRSTTLSCVADILVHPNSNEKYELAYVEVIGSKRMNEYEDGINGYNLPNSSTKSMGIIFDENYGYSDGPEGQKEANDDWLKDPNDFDWIYMNTLEEQKFNKHGFYSNNPRENVKIEGGISDTLLQKILGDNKSQEQLTPCATPRFTGFDANDKNKIVNEGSKYGNHVYNNTSGESSPYYNISGGILSRGMDTLKGKVNF